MASLPRNLRMSGPSNAAAAAWCGRGCDTGFGPLRPIWPSGRTSHAETDKPVRCWPSLPVHAFRDSRPSTYRARGEPRKRAGLVVEDRDRHPGQIIALADAHGEPAPVLAACRAAQIHVRPNPRRAPGRPAQNRLPAKIGYTKGVPIFATHLNSPSIGLWSNMELSLPFFPFSSLTSSTHPCLPQPHFGCQH
jgi:hypothetical protein